MNDNRKLAKYVGILFIGILLTHKLPYDTYTIIEYIIRPVSFKGGRLYLSGLIPLVIIIFALRGLFKLERFENNNKVLIVIAVIVLVMPIMRWTLDTTRTAYHLLNQHELKTLDIVDANIRLSGSEEEAIVTVKLEVIDYGRGENRFNVRMYLPKTLREHTGKEFYDFKNNYRTYGRRNQKVIEEQIIIDLEDQAAHRNLFDSRWFKEDIEYKLYNEKESIKVINRGF
ncbi:hypothetical protein [Isachenkonia alkalipeptolytica]|uniref:Uncharacterized protein n=1 Tax=Isachenkonia alkalipeptolytica TaxID=2565777 RepID=A0AA43XME6_9CLOT|nr:hypothetical protein [Isachenkonia alkalipeptolytica]NBG89478.1 hypothetical protein [Isachenkonia alkalipeptolytica]